MEKNYKIDILCPLYNAEKDFDILMNGIKKQLNVDINKIIFPVTESNDNTYQLAKGVEKSFVYKINKEDFSHSYTREEAVFKYGESNLIVFITQDVILSDEYALFNLAKCIEGNIVHAFARQITKSKGIEKYTREKNYPLDSYVVEKKDIEKMQIKAFYSSDACAIYDRRKFIELGGFDSKKFEVSEDMYYCRKAILNGYAIKYCAESIVTHSHKLSIKEVYKRYYDIGLFFKQNPEFKQYKSTDTGLKLAFYILKKAILKFDFPVLIRWLPDMAARYLGKKKGEK